MALPIISSLRSSIGFSAFNLMSLSARSLDCSTAILSTSDIASIDWVIVSTSVKSIIGLRGTGINEDFRERMGVPGGSHSGFGDQSCSMSALESAIASSLSYAEA